MAGDERFLVDRHSWNDYCCGFQWTALECVPRLSTPWTVYSANDALSDVLPLNTAARTIRTGLYGGLVFGLAQDALGVARGRRLGYVDYFLGSSRNTAEMQGVEG